MVADNEQLAVSRRSVEERIAVVLAQLNYESPPSVEVVNESLDAIIDDEPDQARKNGFLRILPYAANIRLQLCYLAARRRGDELELDGHGYVNEMQNALNAIVTGSYDEQYRKYAITLGVVDTIAEALLLEIAVFDVTGAVDHYAIRKLIANSLTNLTFGNFLSKQRLCRHDHLISTVTKIIESCHNLAVVFAGLIRNLSWRADEEMQLVLAETVPALSHASVRSYIEKDLKCLQAALSALWNLSSHSTRNQMTICEAPRMLEVLIRSLNSRGPNGILENASGIMKYISLYIAKESQRYSEVINQYQLDKRLLNLLTSSSFTILGSVLGALQNLVAHNASLQLKIRHNAVAMNHLTKLSDSNRDDIRAAVKGVLNHLNSSTVADYTFRMSRYQVPHDGNGAVGNEMCSSMTASCNISHHHDSSRLLPRRNAAQHHHLLPCPLTASTYQYQAGTSAESTNFMGFRSATLPRHFETSGHRRNEFHQQVNMPPRPVQLRPPLRQLEHEEANEEFQELSESMRATRSTSMQSLTDDVPNTSEWPSEINTTNNSSRLSPISPSEIPDSPTQCTAPSLPVSVQETPKRTIGIVNPSTSSLGKTVSDDTLVPYAKPEYEIADLPLISETESLKDLGSDTESMAKFKRVYDDDEEDDEDDYGIFEREQCDKILEDTLRDEDDEEDLLSNMIDSVIPKPKTESIEDDGLLLASIASAMPKAKNAKPLARRATGSSTHSHIQSSQDLLKDLQTSSLVTNPSTSEKVRDAAKLAEDSDDNLSEDNFGPLDGVDATVDTSLPDDVESEIKAEKVLIDCSSLPHPKPRGPPPQIPRKPSNLPRATAKIRVGAKSK